MPVVSPASLSDVHSECRVLQPGQEKADPLDMDLCLDRNGAMGPEIYSSSRPDFEKLPLGGSTD